MPTHALLGMFRSPSPPASWHVQGNFGDCSATGRIEKKPLLLLGSHIKHEGHSNAALLGIAGRNLKGFCSLRGVFQRSFQRICRPDVYYTCWIIHRVRNGSLKWDCILASPPANVGDAWHAPGMPAAKH